MSDNTPFNDSTDDESDPGEPTGKAMARIVLWPFLAIAGVAKGFVWGILGIFPKRTAVYRRLIKAGYQGLYHKTDAHVVANTIYGDGAMIPRPAEVDSETGNLETNNDEWWTVENGLETTRVGDVPVTTGVADHHELVDHVGARVAEAVDMGGHRYQPVEDNGQGVEPVDLDADGRRTQAATDGAGQLAPRPSNTFDDIWIDVSNPEPANDGMIVSMKKMYQMHFDRAGSEEMEQQETRGILAAQDPKSQARMTLYVALALGAGVALGLFGPALASQLAGASGGGGGGVPIMLSPLL